jgi:predicted deacylase
MPSPTDSLAFFPSIYETSREKFCAMLAPIKTIWRDAQWLNHPLGDDLTIDWIQADALQQRENLLILTCGEHGGEGYVGAAVLQLFCQEYLTRLKADHTGLLLVHAINPWGMKHWRRTNAANVDLNRNFCESENQFTEYANPSYEKLLSLLNPQSAVRNLAIRNLFFAVRLVKSILALGTKEIHAATLLGQYRFSQGLYYGGTTIQHETRVMMGLYRRCLEEYGHVVLLDMHTGYGPRGQMTLVNSPHERRSSAECQKFYNYPHVVKSDPTEFYAMQGDMIDWFHQCARKEFPNVQFYATAFEFGTLGDSTLALIRSLRVFVLENQMHWFGASDQAREHIASEFHEFFAPQDPQWRAKAIADAQLAFDGILTAEKFI